MVKEASITPVICKLCGGSGVEAHGAADAQPALLLLVGVPCCGKTLVGQKGMCGPAW